MKLIKFKTKKDIVISCLLILLLLVFFASAVMLLWNITRARLEQASFDELRIIVDRAGETDVRTADDETDRIFAQYAELNEKNCDFTGWLTVDGTKIDYPVMCRPDDPSFYLHCDFDGDYSASGTPFLGAGSTVDSDCIIIHGHNMKNDTMFGTLDYYRDKSFCEKNSVIRLDTLSDLIPSCRTVVVMCFMVFEKSLQH